MPKYRITGPDGGTYEVTAPEGATEQDVLTYAQQNYKPAAVKPAVAPKRAAPNDDISKLQRAQDASYAGTGTDQYGRKVGPDFSDVRASVDSTEAPQVVIGGSLDPTDRMGWYEKYLSLIHI